MFTVVCIYRRSSGGTVFGLSDDRSAYGFLGGESLTGRGMTSFEEQCL